MSSDDHKTRTWVPHIELGTVLAVAALLVSGLSFYRSYLYTKQDLQITVTEVSYVTNQGGLYITIAFSNGGNRDAAVLRVEPALWTALESAKPGWRAVLARVHPDIPLTVPNASRREGRRRRGGQALGDAQRRRRRAELARLTRRSVPRHPCRDDELGREPVSSRTRRRAPGARSRGTHSERGAGDSPDAERLRRPEGRAARRSSAVEQKDAVRLGRPAFVSRRDPAAIAGRRRPRRRSSAAPRACASAPPSVRTAYPAANRCR